MLAVFVVLDNGVLSRGRQPLNCMAAGCMCCLCQPHTVPATKAM